MMRISLIQVNGLESEDLEPILKNPKNLKVAKNDIFDYVSLFDTEKSIFKCYKHTKHYQCKILDKL